MEELDCTPPEINTAAKDAIENLLPTKSAGVYETSYRKFLDWCTDKKVTAFSENVLLAYFSHLSKNMKSSTLWSNYSMVKSLLSLKENVDISKYLKLRAFLKKKGENYQPKKAKVLTKEQFDQFVFEAPDEKYLATKVLLIFGIAGACRCHELSRMKVQDIEDFGSMLLVKIPESKTRKQRTFTVVGDEYITKFRQYASLRPNGFDEQRFFLKYQSGKCYRMVIGIHKLGGAAKEVAKFFNLPNWNEYTGHCLRRTSATLLVDRGGDITTLKRHGGWRSSTVAEGYLEDSLEAKKNIANKILGPKHQDNNNVNVEFDQEASTSKCAMKSLHLGNVNNSDLSDVAGSGVFVNATLNSCIFNININK